MKIFISLGEYAPELIKEWHPIKNGELTPYDISYGSARKVWWKCSEGHEWEASISSRSSGCGCPVCSGHKLVVGINDLATVRPDLAAQWHPTKNGAFKPTEVIAGTDKNVWWQCEKGHEWRARINNRISGNSCPICRGKKVLVGYNDLETVNPELANEWHPSKNGNLTPRDVVIGSNKKVWWQCEKGHEWKTAVSHRGLRGTGCPVCAGEIKTSFPEQAIFFYFSQFTTAYNRYMIEPKTEIDIYLPEYKIGIEYDGVYFHNSEKAEQREKRKQDRLNKLGVLLIRVREDEKIAGEHTVFAKPGASDKELTLTVDKLISYFCSITGASIEIDIDVARDRNSIYEQYILMKKENSLIALNPALASEWHPTKNGKLSPEMVTVSSNKKVWWKCAKGHEWSATIKSRRDGVGCPFCAGKRAIIGETDLATVNPVLASEWHPTQNGDLKPQDVTGHSNKSVWWQCPKGHEWKTSPAHRSRGSGCPICSGHKVLVGYNDLATVNPVLASEWHPTKNGTLTVHDVTVGSDKKVWWKCAEGHEWEAAISSRCSGNGCPHCAGQKVITGYNDLLTVNPSLASEWHPTKNGDLTPSDVMPGSNKKVWWLGGCGHEWEAVIVSRNAGRGCPYCSSQKLLVGFNDLQTRNPELASEWHPTKNGSLTPNDVMPGTNKKVWWLCKKGHEWENSINVRNGGNDCPYCANQIVLKGYNDLATLNPRLASEWHPTKNGDLTPSDVMPGSNKKAWWICKNGHEWEAVISSRNKGAGCMACYRLKRKKVQ